MPWAKRPDGTWGNVDVAVPVPLAPPLPQVPDDEPAPVVAAALLPTKHRPAPPRPPKASHIRPSVPPEAATEVVPPWLAELRQAKAAAPTAAPRDKERDMTEAEEAEIGAKEEREHDPPPSVRHTPPLPKRMATGSLPASGRRAAPPIPEHHRPIAIPTRPALPPRATSSDPSLPELVRPPLPRRRSSPVLATSDAVPITPHPPPVPNLPPRHTPTTSHGRPPMRTKPSAGSGSGSASAPTWKDDKQGFAKHQAVEFARNRRDPLNPPPACFSRVPPPISDENEEGVRITYCDLPEPIVLRSHNSNDLAKAYTTGRAFPTRPPALPSHDVYREDWERLWDDMDEMARIELRTQAGVSIATLPLMPIFGAGFVASNLVERKLRAQRVGPTCKLVEAYNVTFFRPRHLDVYIAQDSTRLSGPCPTTDSRRAYDPAYLRWQAAENEFDKAKALKEMEKWKGNFRFVVQSWPPP